MDQQNSEWPELAVAIIPYQKYSELYKVSEALYKGTIFPALYRPYEPGKGWDSL